MSKKSVIFQELKDEQPLILGIERSDLYYDSLVGKRIAIISNQSSVVNGTHLVDTLLALKLNVVKVFSPEHGFRGYGDAGEKIGNSYDEKTGIEIVSLYGNNKKPKESQLADVDIVIYDIQDVGVRFYTYISTLHYVMEACAEQDKKLIIFDRPNPNGYYVDGPILEMPYKSFVGMHAVPIVYGMTVGEYANMINGESWLGENRVCKLWVIPCKNYTHDTFYKLPIAPSPNLKSEISITLYPSLCFFEATTVSVGRGTDKPFEIYGHPNFPNNLYSFIPKSKIGAKNPPQLNTICYGFDLSNNSKKRPTQIDLSYLLKARDILDDSIPFIDQPIFFNSLAGNSSFQEQLIQGFSENEIRESWKPGLEKFLDIRKKYLLYN